MLTMAVDAQDTALPIPVPPPAVLVTLSRNARRLRQARGLTLRSLASRSGLSLRFLMDVEAGRGNISIRRLAELADALETTAADLVTPARDAETMPVIALLGLRGAGKSTIGRRLARRLKRRFVELDHAIEARAGLTLAEIFSLHGEEYYRRLERAALAELLATRQPVVVAVGGGLVTAPDSYELLLRSTTTVWLKARPEDYWNRVIRQGDRRPMDQHPQARAALQQLVMEREPLYARASLTLDTADQSVDAVVRKLVGSVGSVGSVSPVGSRGRGPGTKVR
jgi:XRE family aerobic/anaerobic benzoate catabolism transcriptional regulator